MPTVPQFQYQVDTDGGIAFANPIKQFESWHGPLSEPVRFKRDPRLNVALMASGPFQTLLGAAILDINLESKWHQGWSEPVRLKPRLRTGINQFATTYFDILPKPANQIQGWFAPLREPVWPKKGLKIYLQQTLAAPPRLLPPANVTVILSALETNNDIFLAGVVPQNAAESARVSIKEVPAIAGGMASIEEL